MKKYFIISILFFSAMVSYAQTTTNIDDGYGDIKMDQTFKPIENLLIEVKKETLWKAPSTPEMIPKTYIVNLSKLKTTIFFGLKITRIEVQFDEENIFEFTLFMEAPSKTDYKLFFNKLVENYGWPPATTYDENMNECPNWFTNITMLIVSGETVAVEKNGKKYIYADFVQGYGG